MTDAEKALRMRLVEGPQEGPWQIRMGRDKFGSTGYQVCAHTHAAMCIAAEDYYPSPKYFPDMDEDGFYQPDERIDCFGHRVATARYIAAANPLAMQAILDDLEHARREADRWEKRARSLGWSDEAETRRCWR
jgi:hypothetical protein